MSDIAMTKKAWEALSFPAKVGLLKKYGPKVARGVGAVAAATPNWLLLGGALAAGVAYYKRRKSP